MKCVSKLPGLLVVLVLLLGAVYPTAAQGGDTTIHVVQRGDTLFHIAQEYGTTVEAITTANGIDDPRYLAVGQRLLIPGAQINAPGTPFTYTVQPGDSLAAITQAYQTTADSLSSANYITNPAQLYIGQQLTIKQGASDTGNTFAPPIRTLHHVRPDENPFRIALQYGVTLNQLRQANPLEFPFIVFPGQRLWIPGSKDAIPTRFNDLPLPLTSYTLTPGTGVQGQTLAIHITTTGPAQLSGTFMGYPLQFITQETNHHSALTGIHAFAQGGVHPMTLTVTEPDGTETPFTLRVLVADGGYGAENISLTTEKQDLLNTDVTEPEWQKFATVMSTFTDQRYFDGVMGLPSTGPVTSVFGTRRNYNGGVLDTFHSGTDFGSAPDSPILAPAAGIVMLVENLPVRGNLTIIDHGWGVCTAYFHQNDFRVAVGDVVVPGQVIGTVGSTGRSTGPHLHWEMWVNGVQVDPMQWVQQKFP
ncbi:MAG: LysM peptidoglycan-binding domain-containing protein [Anaerolineae bacterium]|nr:LysM peptidoglycan-binding domain-containing protein [Anaerolineae bacterium]